jgi:PAS domain S-box-containing protein
MKTFETDNFNQQIQAAQDRFQELKQRSQKFPWAQNEMASEAMEELSIALEELHVAAEEMREQHEHLMITQESLATERQRYIDLFEFAPNGYVVTDIAGHIQEANWAAVSLLGMPHDQLMGRLLIVFIPTENRPTFRAMFSRIEQAPIQNWEGSIQQYKQNVLPCEITVSPIYDAQKSLVGLRWLIRDMSDRQRIIEMETASRVKDEFLAIVSHELRSPLNPILGWSKLLRDRKLNPAMTDKALDAIERNATLQSQLVEDLLDVSRILRSKLSLNRAQVDLRSIVDSVLETVNLSAEAKGIRLVFTDAPAAIYVLGDPIRLQQIVANLLSNAIKFTPSGGCVTLTLASENLPSESSPEEPEINPSVQPAAQIIITDTGRGISADFLPFIFEHFRQADSSSTRKFSGLGLGLAIVHYLVETHGGTIQAESPGEGQGATFTVTLPLLSAALSSPTKASAVRPYNLTGLKVLLVDDEPDTLEFMVFLLEREGAIVTAVDSAPAAIAALSQFTPDLLISDIGMPEVDGYSLLHQIQTHLTRKGKSVPPAIALTAYAGDHNARQALAAGFQRHLPKPVDLEMLLGAIGELVSK